MARIIYPLILLTTVAFGCVSTRVREEAKLTLSCDVVHVEENDEHQSWVARGCGREAICEVPDVKDADVQCAGGAAPRSTKAR